VTCLHTNSPGHIWTTLYIGNSETCWVTTPNTGQDTVSYLSYLAHGVINKAPAFTPVVQCQTFTCFILTDEGWSSHARIRELEVFMQVVQSWQKRNWKGIARKLTRNDLATILAFAWRDWKKPGTLRLVRYLQHVCSIVSLARLLCHFFLLNYKTQKLFLSQEITIT
jgi:hypothetical protein